MHTGYKLETDGPVCKCMDCARKRKERKDALAGVPTDMQIIAQAQRVYQKEDGIRCLGVESGHIPNIRREKDGAWVTAQVWVDIPFT